jgi:2-dehydro-3-deoxyphosphogluconate aldolase/(4S)-4-hydroxy-2-oxoglutarate aldolase
MGGAKYIKALKGPFPQVEMIPTGGVSLETAADFLRAGSCAIAVGGELVSAAALKTNDYAFIENTARQFVEIVQKTRSELSGS